jgi:hypothetical protein
MKLGPLYDVYGRTALSCRKPGRALSSIFFVWVKIADTALSAMTRRLDCFASLAMTVTRFR